MSKPVPIPYEQRIARARKGLAFDSMYILPLFEELGRMSAIEYLGGDEGLLRAIVLEINESNSVESGCDMSVTLAELAYNLDRAKTNTTLVWGAAIALALVPLQITEDRKLTRARFSRGASWASGRGEKTRLLVRVCKTNLVELCDCLDELTGIPDLWDGYPPLQKKADGSFLTIGEACSFICRNRQDRRAEETFRFLIHQIAHIWPMINRGE